MYYAPEGLEAGAPLIFVLHGYWGWASDMAGFSGFRELADEEGFAVVFPQGLEDDLGTNHWNANFTFSSVNDTGFLVALAEHLQATYGHDPECTYSCGYSNGGYMSYTLACDAASTFRGIGSVGGTMSAYDWNNCTPSQAVPVIHLHGTDDNAVPYEGSPNWDFGWGEQPGVETIVSTWADWNNCTEVSETALPNLNTTDGSTVDLIEHTGGDDGYRALVYRVNDGGHNWFGSWGNMDIVSAVEMWNFWSSFCGSTSSIASAEALQAKIFSWKNAEITAEQACHVAVYDALGRKVLDRPLMAGQTLRINKAQLHLIVARNLKGQFQQEKVWLD
ncbi:MAG: PHB depolymerase family esterase [Flavobacteriales bacterium]|nr:PHB depolymerase family esterase [Flavobacteriales bacterium]